MSSLIDLREHFGIWNRCGNSRFFQKEGRYGEKLFLNPLDGVRVSANPTRYPDGRITYSLFVQDASKATDGDIEKVFEENSPYPWIEKAVRRFFYFQAMGWAADALKEYFGKDPLPGDKDMGNFLSIYKSGGESYRKEGGRDYKQFVWEGDVLIDRGDVPLLEETLEAISRTIGGMHSTIVDYGRDLSEADVEEALAERGILEC